ncbi:hypothetical protein BpHYR1_015366 [Brachionus plicatilis]|uniref:Uncharacterized protein n=1 Tax=Brachionus plicatilis TaxID=10195 RepID=A0A3M7P3S6_BRAPC|nr:hypothetical protein BpHYR1_015366 [Brachionus plicatilis]
MVTFDNNLFNSSSFLIASYKCLGIILDFKKDIADESSEVRYYDSRVCPVKRINDFVGKVCQTLRLTFLEFHSLRLAIQY